MTTNRYCEVLGIQPPNLEVAKQARGAKFYELLIIALLERGGPITLAEVARRLEEAGVASAEQALVSLKRCRPARPPVHRDGDLYALDPHDHEADLWVFRLGLSPPKVPALHAVRPEPGPLPCVDEPLSVAHLEEAWRAGIPAGWSAQRLAICVLDAHGGAMPDAQVVAFVAARGRQGTLSVHSAHYWRQGSAIRVGDGGMWELDTGHDALRSARQAVLERVAGARRWAHQRTEPAVLEATRKHIERERTARNEQLARMRRVLIHAFPAGKPEAIVLVDIKRRGISTFLGEAMGTVGERLLEYENIAAVNVRALLRSLDFEPGERRLGELSPPHKTKTLNRQGRKLKITLSLLVQGSCGIGRPFGDEKVLRGYLRDGNHTKLRRRLEADAKSLFAYYQYGRLHGSVRLRWGFVDERLTAPWVHRDEWTLYSLMQQAHDLGVPLEVVVGNAPGWADPWSRACRGYVQEEQGRWQSWLVDEYGQVIDEDEVQLARLVVQDRGTE